MPCFSQKTAYQSRGCNWSKYEIGKNSPLRFSVSIDDLRRQKYSEIKVDCEQCIGCKMRRARHFSMRVMDESLQYKRNCFITLTYNTESLPPYGSLRMSDVQSFVKRLRKKLLKKGVKIRTFGGMEYGDIGGRPHYHIIIFGYDFSEDRFPIRYERGNVLYDSPFLAQTWGNGFVSVGSLTPDSAIYVCKYITAKANNTLADNKYVVSIDGKKVQLTHEGSCAMSRRPGLGRKFFEKNWFNMFPHDYRYENGHKVKPPRYYTKLFRKMAESDYFAMIDARIADASKVRLAPDYEERLAAKKETVILRMAEYRLRKHQQKMQRKKNEKPFLLCV